MKRRNIMETSGYLAYWADEIFVLNEPFELMDRDELDDDDAPMHWQNELEYIQLADSGRTLRDLCDSRDTRMPSQFLRICLKHAELLAEGASSCVKVLHRSKRFKQDKPLRNFPMPSAIS